MQEFLGQGKEFIFYFIYTEGSFKDFMWQEDMICFMFWQTLGSCMEP